MIALDKYSFNGHRVIMGGHSNDWQDTGAVLQLFGEKLSDARSQYRAYVEKVLAAAEEKMKRRCAFQAKGVNLESLAGLAERVAEILDMPSSDLP